MKRLEARVCSFYLLASVTVAAGCGGSKKHVGDEPGNGGGGGGTSGTNVDGGVVAMRQPLRIVSAPVQNASAGERTRYRVVTSQPGASYQLKRAPAGANVDSAGIVTWTPTDGQGGDQTFEVEATADGQTATQVFKVSTATAVVQAASLIEPDSANVGTVSVDAPLSRIRGTAVQVEPGSIASTTPVRVSIAAVDNAPVPPAARVARVPAADLAPVELGPSGTAFRKPVKLQLPVSAAVALKGRPDVLTFDYATGRWEKVKVLSFDKDRGVAVAEVSHFSTYVAAPAANIFAPSLALGGAKCKDALVVRAPLGVSFTDIPANLVNGYTGAGATAADVVAGMQSGQALQVFIRATAHTPDATGTQSGWILGSATKLEDGKLRVRVSSDAHGSAFLSTPAGLDASDPDLAAWLNGSRTHFIFNGMGSLTGGASARLEASLYLVPSVDADRPPTETVNALAFEEVSADQLSPIDFDDDCDRAPNAYDPTPQGDAPPILTATPVGPVRIGMGGTVKLTIASSVAATTLSWGASDPGVGMTVSVDGASATIVPTVAGTFRVNVLATAGAAEARWAWDVVADPQAGNTPPTVAVAASTFVARAGEDVTLTAIGRDLEQTRLTYRWSARSPGGLSADNGDTVLFSASVAGEYLVNCVASDGFVETPGAVTITVLTAKANRPPPPPTVTPMNAILQHEAGTTVAMALIASSTDPDGDVVTYDFDPAPDIASSLSLVKNGPLATLSTTSDGVFVLYVTAQDAKGATSPWTPVRIQVIQTLPAMPVDNDKDGYPSIGDCNDNDATIYPGAREICGDGIDQDCYGGDLGAAACDADGDRYSPDMGDCNDKNPGVNPSASERCDGVDNNCDGRVDEGYDVGKECRVGEGACQVMGMTICGASHVEVVCNGTQRQPQPETCDGIDNDCNGQVDDVTPDATNSDVKSCGSCNVACPAPAHTVPACVRGGCTAACAAGFVDADRVPTNGCECALTNGGVEICDGIDNDCNGSIDERVTEVYYPGPTGTLGVGVCAAGLRACEGGKLVVKSIPVEPSLEVCDGVDNDCNGKADETTDLQNDRSNCGRCGVICEERAACDKGRCVLPPGVDAGSAQDAAAPSTGDGGLTTPPGPPAEILAMCPDPSGMKLCTDLTRDRMNCGACGTACAANEFCFGGRCSAGDQGCYAPKKLCPDPVNPTAAYCTDPMFDDRNCGGCGIRCTAGPCQMGVCTNGNGCNEPRKMCPDPANPQMLVCRDVMYDDFNCGGCGNRCTTGPCQNGLCTTGGGGTTPKCPPGAPYLCGDPMRGDYCTDIMHDPGNCGGCGIHCANSVYCEAGRCSGTPVDGGGGGPTNCAPPFPNPCPSPQGGNYCTDIMQDPGNCGRCAFRCPDGVGCNMGQCSGTTSPPPVLTCPGSAPNGCSRPDTSTYCTNVLSDPGNCGGCGSTCPSGIFCQGGACGGGPPPDGGVPSCPDTASAQCRAPSGELFCADLMTDTANCGACGRGCPAGARCQQGVCSAGGTPSCPPDVPTHCPSPMGDYCTDLMRDPGNCGSCGVQCPQGVYCQGGQCSGTSPHPPPPQPLMACPPDLPNGCINSAGGPFCTNVLRDPGNCGKCGQGCGTDAACMMGACVGAVPPDGGGPPGCPATASSSCDNPAGPYCADLMTDLTNCGSCRNACPSNARCESGVCSGGATSPCPPGSPNICQIPNGGTFCTDFMHDSGNCGGCDMRCADGVFCDAGKCTGTAPPPPPPNSCPDDIPNGCPGASGGSYCSNFLRDPGNCGKCGFACAPGVPCNAGVCGGPAPSPDGGTAVMCPASAPNSCGTPMGPYCTDFMTDLSNCGNCHSPCPYGARCSQGVCSGGGPTCSPSQPNVCTYPTGESLCTNFMSDPGNCGGCFNRCPNSPCNMGRCDSPPPPSCPPDQSNVCQTTQGGTYCTNFSRDDRNCGGCGLSCPNGVPCIDGRCNSDPNACVQPFTACGAGCAIPSDDPDNCGSCGHTCPGVCEFSACVGAGTNPFGKPCAHSAECTAGSLCFDQMRFGWPGGYCTAFCSDSRPCGLNQVCITAKGGGGIGSCRGKCMTDTDCGRPGYICSSGLCAPDCRMAPQVCEGGYACDATGNCVPTSNPPAQCPPELRSCAGPEGKTYCADVRYDSQNCGTCGVVCSNGMTCQDGRCISTGASIPGLMACPGAGGAPMCVAVYRDNNNCGSCGNICPAGTNCEGGRCSSGPTCEVPMKLCYDPMAGKAYCTDLKYDPGNCGNCGTQCASDHYCKDGSCILAPPAPDGGVTNPPQMCPAGLKPCSDPDGKPYCADVSRDPYNCGGCHVSCVSGMCQNYACAASNQADGGPPPPSCPVPTQPCRDATGYTYCADFKYDVKNCGGCGLVCPFGLTCTQGACQSAP